MNPSWAVRLILLSDKDLQALSAALQAHKSITLTRTLDNQSVTVRTLKAAPVWGTDWLVQVRVQTARVEWVQTFVSVQQAREALDERVFPEKQRN